MKREDLLTDDEALDRALAALEGSPVPAKKASKMARTALAAAGLLSVSTAVHAWAIGTLVVGSLVATSGTAYLVLRSGARGGRFLGTKRRRRSPLPPWRVSQKGRTRPAT